MKIEVMVVCAVVAALGLAWFHSQVGSRGMALVYWKANRQLPHMGWRDILCKMAQGASDSFYFWGVRGWISA